MFWISFKDTQNANLQKLAQSTANHQGWSHFTEATHIDGMTTLVFADGENDEGKIERDVAAKTLSEFQVLGRGEWALD